MIVRTLLAFLTAAVLVLPTQSATASESPKDRAKQRLALRSAAEALSSGRESLVEGSSGKLSVLIENALHEAMLANPANHITPKQSATLCRELVGNRAKHALESLENEALLLARGHSPIPVTRAALFKALGVSAETFHEDAMQKIVKQHADSLFKQARKRAVERQLRETSLRVGYPTQDRANALLEELAENRKKGKPLKRADILKLEPTLQQELGLDKLPIFAEVNARLRQLALHVLGQLGDQYEAQVEALVTASKAPESAAEVVRERIAPKLVDAVKREVAKQRDVPNRDEAVRIYDIFTPVLAFAQDRAEALEVSSLANFARTAGCSWPGEQDVDTVLRANIGPHRKPLESLVLLTDVYRDRAIERLATAYLATSGLTADNQSAFQPRMTQHLTKNPECRKAFALALEGCITERSKTVRARIASEQAAPLLEALGSLERLEDKTVDWLSGKQALHPYKTLKAANSFITSRKGLRISRLPADPIFQEAEDQLLARVNALVSPAAEAHAAQRSLILKLANDWQESLKQSIADNVPLPDIRKTWRTELDARYAAFQEKHDSVYNTLFPSNEAELEKVLRQHFESLKKQAAAAIVTSNDTLDATEDVQTEQRPTDVREKQPEPPEDAEEGSSSAEGGSGVTEIEEPLAFTRRAAVSILLRDVDSKTCELVVSYGELDQQRVVRFEPGSDDDVTATIVAGMDIEMLAKALGLQRPRRGFFGLGRKRNDPVDVVVLAQSRLVRYRTMVRVREQLAGLLAERSAASGVTLPEMEWSAASEVESDFEPDGN